MGPKYIFYSETCVSGICQLYIVADISAMERESGEVDKIFNKILIPSYNGDILMVAMVDYRKVTLDRGNGRLQEERFDKG